MSYISFSKPSGISDWRLSHILQNSRYEANELPAFDYDQDMVMAAGILITYDRFATTLTAVEIDAARGLPPAQPAIRMMYLLGGIPDDPDDPAIAEKNFELALNCVLGFFGFDGDSHEQRKESVISLAEKYAHKHHFTFFRYRRGNFNGIIFVTEELNFHIRETDGLPDIVHIIDWRYLANQELKEMQDSRPEDSPKSEMISRRYAEISGDTVKYALRRSRNLVLRSEITGYGNTGSTERHEELVVALTGN